MQVEAKYALRSLIRRPGYAGTAVTVLGCAIGAATAVFALVDAVLIRSLPLRDPGRLAVVWAAEPEHPLIEISYPDFLDFRRETRAFEDVAAHGSTPWPTVLTGVGDTVKLSCSSVSGSFFDLLGVRAQLGRTLQPSDDVPGAPAVVVLSHALWQERFGGDPAVIGRVISLDGRPHTIVGVTTPRFDYPVGSRLWMPLTLTIEGLSAEAKENLRIIGYLYMVARRAPGISQQQAIDDSSSLIRGLRNRYHGSGTQGRAVLTPLTHQVLGRTRPALLLLGAAVALVLLLAWINIAGLALVRATARQPEIAVRYALGASRANIRALFLGEAILLCGAALLLALPLAVLTIRFFIALAPAGAAGVQDAAIDVRALAFAVCAASIAAVGAGAFRSRSVTSSARLTSSERVIGHQSKRRQIIIAAEVALTLTVLSGAGLAARSFWNLRTLDLGYAAEQVLLLETTGKDDPRIGEALARLPGVRAVGAVSLKPLTLGPIGDDVAFQLEGQSLAEARRNPALNRLAATPGYFNAMGIRLLAGRFFEARDLTGGDPIAIVSDVTARAVWGRVDVVGRKIRVVELNPATLPTTIVGVVSSVRHRQLHEARLDFYVPTRYASTWAIRTAGDPVSLAAAARTAIRETDPGHPVETVTLNSLVTTAQRPWQFAALILSTFAALALLLAATAVHGLVAYAVSLRVNEFGIRMALGATPRNIVWLVFQSIGRVALAGLIVGVPASLAAARAMRSLLFEVSPLDLASLAAAIVVLAAALVAACFVPSRRAARVDPTVALRAL